MPTQNKLIFFNNQGDCLNFRYNNINERFEGDILFDENSSDTYKTFGLYTLEVVPSFEIESDKISLEKFQLFNEYGLSFYESKYLTQSITKIEPVNGDNNFYSKWIYGNDFDVKFPIGSIIKFNDSILEFTYSLSSYIVSFSKKNAIGIISNIDNYTFEQQYNYNNTSIYASSSISSINAIGINNYLNPLSSWNESDFYNNLYIGRKVNINNSKLNDGISTIIEDSLLDQEYFNYLLATMSMYSNQNLFIEVLSKTDLPKIYDDILEITNDSRLIFYGTYPSILKPGSEFKITGSASILNSNFLTIKNIPSFTGNTQQIFYATQSHTIWNNTIYECVQAYTQSYSGSTKFITPDNSSYWTQSISYIEVNESTFTQSATSSQLYLTTNKLVFEQGWTISNIVTLASAAERYKSELSIFNIDLYYNDEQLNANLIYPSKYAEVNFYQDQYSPTYSIGTQSIVKEKLIQFSDLLYSDKDKGTSSNFEQTIVFTDLDQWGLKLVINNEIYESEIVWVYSGINISMPDTIDETLKYWLSTNKPRLDSLGINPELGYISTTYSLYNAIVLKTQYPNVPMIINDILVGSSADYYIQHSEVLFNEIGSYISIRINDDSFGQSSIAATSSYDISATLESWTEEHYEYLLSFGIIVGSDGNLLKFNKKNGKRLDYTISNGIISLPGQEGYIIYDKILGNQGTVLSSNSIISTTSSFYFSDFNLSTGMILSINNSCYPLNNKEYKIQYLSDSIIGLSYEGSFWGGTQSFTYSTLIGSTNSNDITYGTLSPDYIPKSNIWISSREYVRKPRENYKVFGIPVKYYYKWYSDNIPEFFLYDFTGDQLETTGSYSYIGPKPLTIPILNKYPNREVTRTSLPEYQQTVFDTVEYTISYIDDDLDISSNPEPLQTYIGFKSENEGGLRSILQLWKKEEISFDISSSQNTYILLETIDVYGNNKHGKISINQSSSDQFTNRGLKEGQHISINIKDDTNLKNQYISSNNGIIVKIRNIYTKILIVDFIEDGDFLFYEQTLLSNYPTSPSITYLKVTINVIDKEIGRFMVYGQTEVEDIRFKTQLGNYGKLIGPNESFIFKEYDINEGGIDWKFLNKKRKEMLMMKHLIYPYIGAYKSIINAINFFGYNDLQLNEYYRDVNPVSEKFLKLFKLEIPDIFDNSVDGWTENEYIMNNFPNEDYEETNMFNLTYFMTDIDGNKINTYTTDEIVIKLQGLKYWLKRNIIPLTHKILDITGRTFIKSQTEISHTSYDINIKNIKENMTPITFKLNEAYLMPVNSGSSVYNCVLDFYSIIDNIGSEKNTKTLPYNGILVEPPDYFELKIKTYKTYEEWNPFTTYQYLDKVYYYGKLYESSIEANRTRNPKKYESVIDWKPDAIYEYTNIVKYENDIFIYGSTSSGTYSITPIIDTLNWLKITEWKEIDYKPVQTIKEFRRIPQLGTQSSDSLLEIPNPIPPFNFTIDMNIDPLVSIELTTENGYGLIYMDKKNYEIRGNRSLSNSTISLDQIGPFVPISPI